MRRVLLLLALSLPCAAEGQERVAACPAGPSAVPLLSDYSALRPGSRHRVRVRWRATTRAWEPYPQLDMPLHHASAIEFAEGAALPAGGPDLELTVVAIDRTLVRYSQREHTWFFHYRVRVESICAPADRAGARN